MKRIISLLLTSIIMFSNVSIAFADINKVQSGYDDYIGLTHSGNLSSQDDSTILAFDKTVSAIAKYQAFIDASYQYSFIGDDSSEEWTSFIETLTTATDNMSNSIATVDLGSDVKERLSTIDISSKESIQKDIRLIMSYSIPEILEVLLVDLDVEDIDGAKAQTLTAVNDILKNIEVYNERYVVLDDDTDEEKTIKEISKYNTDTAKRVQSDQKAKLDTGADIIDKQIDSGAIDTGEVVKTAISDYAYLLESVAHVTREDIDTLATVLEKYPTLEDLDLTGPDLFKPVDGYANSVQDYRRDKDSTRVTSLYLDMFASTSVYRPFLSKQGDGDYMLALSSLVSESDQVEAEKLFTEISSYKKPLYYLADKSQIKEAQKNDISYSYTEYSGQVIRVTLNDLLMSVENQSSLVLVMKKGKLVQDGDGFIYKNNELTTLNGELAVSQTVNEDSKETSVNSSSATRAVYELSYTSKNAIIGNSYKAASGNTNGAILNNIYNQQAVKSEWSARGDETLFMDAIGNIVLKDNTVIIPAASNATFMSIIFQEATDSISGTVYNPFTVANMNSYPAVSGSKSYYYIGTARDKDKTFFVSGDKQARSTTPSIIPVYYNNVRGFAADVVHQIGVLLYPDFYVANGDDFTTVSNLITIINGSVNYQTGDLSEILNPDLSSGLNSYPIKFNDLSSNGVQVFPYSGSNVYDDTHPAIIIAKNFRKFLTNKEVLDGAGQGNGYLRETYMVNQIVQPVLDGIYTPMLYDKARQGEDISNGLYNYNFIDRMFIQMPSLLLGIANNVDSYLGVSTNMADNYVAIFKTLIKYFYYILAFIIVLLGISLIRSGGRGLSSIFSLLLLLGLLVLSLFILPVIMPTVYNTPMTLLTKDIVSDVLLVNNEQYNKTFSESYMEDLPTVPIYQFSFQEMQKFTQAGDNIFTYQEFLDEETGLILKNTKLHLDLGDLFSSYMINNDVENSLGSTELNIQTTNKERREILNYYAPFDLLQDGFIKTLQTYQDNWEVPKEFIGYPDGVYKESYLVSSYIRSYPFLRIIPEVDLDLRTQDNIYEIEKIEQVFPNTGDILNLSSFVESELDEVPQEIQDTLWFQTLLDLGYYSPAVGLERRTLLADVVNMETYDFLLRVAPEAGLVSDDNIIKLTTLYAMIAFNREVSTFGYNLYPRSIDVGNITVSELLTSTLLRDSQRYLYYSVDLVTKVYADNGPLGSIILSALILVSIAQALITIFIQGFMYIGLIVICIIYLLKGGDFYNITQSILKIALILMVHIVAINSIWLLYLTAIVPSSLLLITSIMFLECYLVIKFIIRSIKPIFSGERVRSSRDNFLERFQK